MCWKAQDCCFVNPSRWFSNMRHHCGQFLNRSIELIAAMFFRSITCLSAIPSRKKRVKWEESISYLFAVIVDKHIFPTCKHWHSSRFSVVVFTYFAKQLKRDLFCFFRCDVKHKKKPANFIQSKTITSCLVHELRLCQTLKSLDHFFLLQKLFIVRYVVFFIDI